MSKKRLRVRMARPDEVEGLYRSTGTIVGFTSPRRPAAPAAGPGPQRGVSARDARERDRKTERGER